jgi:muramoyltetrapeptide carboxypeptidase
VEALNWDTFKRHPKWIIGFSDVTVFHQKIHQFGIESIHGIMPLGFTEGSVEAKETLRLALFGKSVLLETLSQKENKLGEVRGPLVGGNMTIIYSLMQTELSYSFENKILFIEDIGEHIYKIDRMLYAFKMAGIFNQIKGLILGGFTDMEDTDVPFGKTIEELVLEQVHNLDIPVAFNMPIGHIHDNRSLVVGRTVSLRVTDTKTTLLI